MMFYEKGSINTRAEQKTPVETPQNAPFKANKDEILYNIINSGLTGLLAGLSAIQINAPLKLACALGLIAGITRFKIYWNNEKREYCKRGLFCFI